MDALKIYGKDWQMIEWKVLTRSQDQIEQHAKKFKVRMQKIVTHSQRPEEIDDAMRYIIILE